MAKTSSSLVIVESPAKANTIKKFLGRGYKVIASVGHVMDLPKNKLGVDLDDGFTPEYVVPKGKKKLLDQIFNKYLEGYPYTLTCIGWRPSRCPMATDRSG